MSKTARAPRNKPRPQAKLAPSATVFEFRVTLLGTDPPIWRTIQVLPDSLGDLHLAIQAAMGWEDCHLFEFALGRRRFSEIDADGPTWDNEAEDAFETQLLDLIPGNKRKKFALRYTYDFGDSWEHAVELVGRHEREEKTRYPLCSGGERACPPEDCGGVWGFQDLLAARDDPQNEEHDYYQEWLGEYDPAAFDAKEATKRMQAWK